MHSAGSRRPGGRTAAVRTAVLAATVDLLTESGFHGLDLTAVAARAGVGKTTVYRRWGTSQALVADLLVEMADESVPRSDTGTLPGDLLANARLVVDTLTHPRQGRLFKAVISAATYDSAAMAALAGFYDRRVVEWSHCVDTGITRGEAPPGTDAAATIRHLSAPLYYQFLTTTTPLTDDDAQQATAATLAAIAAGVFVRKGVGPT